MGRGSWGFSWGLKERDVGGSNGGGGAAWRERRCRGGGGGGVEEKAVAWRPGDFNVTGGGFVVESGESGGVVVEGAASWWRGRRCGGEGSTWDFSFNVRERERICDLLFVFLIFNFIYLTNLIV